MEIFKKEVDWSVFVDGMNIPLAVQAMLFHQLGYNLARGERKDISIELDGQKYLAQLRSLPMRSAPERGDMIHVRYSSDSPIAVKMREIYTEQYAFLCSEREGQPSRKHIRLPDDLYQEISICVENAELRFVAG